MVSAASAFFRRHVLQGSRWRRGQLVTLAINPVGQTPEVRARDELAQLVVDGFASDGTNCSLRTEGPDSQPATIVPQTIALITECRSLDHEVIN